MLTYEYIIFIVITILLHLAVLYFVTRKRKKSLVNRHVVITGGSSGIGLWAAIYCAKLGAHVTIIARNVKLLGKRISCYVSCVHPNNTFIFIISGKAVELIKVHTNPDLQRVQYISFDLSKSSYHETELMLERAEHIDSPTGLNFPIFMLVNCAGMAICGEFIYNNFNQRRSDYSRTLQVLLRKHPLMMFIK